VSHSRNVQHIVFSTKERQPWISGDLQPDLYAYMGGIARKHRCVLMEAGGIADHVHLLMLVHSTVAIADLVRDVKSGSSRWVHDTFGNLKFFAWQSKYGAFSVSHSMENTVTAYIRNQATHHRKKSFKDEYRVLLERHGIEYDERYVWE
jgi:REP element-mobilizing transposase RayT